MVAESRLRLQGPLTPAATRSRQESAACPGEPHRHVYELAVPARRGEQYTMADLWNPWLSVLRRCYVALGRDVEHELPMLPRLTDLPNVRNMLAAHENEFAAEFPLATIREMARDVISLVGALYCRACRSFVAPEPEARRPTLMQCRQRHIVVLPGDRAAGGG